MPLFHFTRKDHSYGFEYVILSDSEDAAVIIVSEHIEKNQENYFIDDKETIEDWDIEIVEPNRLLPFYNG